MNIFDTVDSVAKSYFKEGDVILILGEKAIGDRIPRNGLAVPRTHVTGNDMIPTADDEVKIEILPVPAGGINPLQAAQEEVNKYHAVAATPWEPRESITTLTSKRTHEGKVWLPIQAPFVTGNAFEDDRNKWIDASHVVSVNGLHGDVTLGAAEIGSYTKEQVDKLIADAIAKIPPPMDSTPIGAVTAYWGTTPPKNYVECDGSLFPNWKYPELFKLLKDNSPQIEHDLWLGEKADFKSDVVISGKDQINKANSVVYSPFAFDALLKVPAGVPANKHGHLVTPKGRPDLVAKLTWLCYQTPVSGEYYLSMVKGVWDDFFNAAQNNTLEYYKQSPQALGTKIKTTVGLTSSGNLSSTYGIASFTNGVSTSLANPNLKLPYTRAIYWYSTSEAAANTGVFHNKLATPIGNPNLIVRLVKTFRMDSSSQANFACYYLEPVKGTVDEFCDAVAGKQVDIYEPAPVSITPPEGQAYLPDLRGEFVRGWDHGRGVDADRKLGSWQGDAIRNITGKIAGPMPRTGADYATDTGVFTTDTLTSYSAFYINPATVGGSLFDASKVVPTAKDNRPRNVALMYCIYAGEAQPEVGKYLIDHADAGIEYTKHYFTSTNAAAGMDLKVKCDAAKGVLVSWKFRMIAGNGTTDVRPLGTVDTQDVVLNQWYEGMGTVDADGTLFALSGNFEAETKIEYVVNDVPPNFTVGTGTASGRAWYGYSNTGDGFFGTYTDTAKPPFTITRIAYDTAGKTTYVHFTNSGAVGYYKIAIEAFGVSATSGSFDKSNTFVALDSGDIFDFTNKVGESAYLNLTIKNA